jgi:hypothetical protein
MAKVKRPLKDPLGRKGLKRAAFECYEFKHYLFAPQFS